MIRLFAIVIITLICSCSVATNKYQKMTNLPHSPYAWQIKVPGEPPDEARVSSAILVFYKSWKAEFGDSKGLVKASLDKLMIEWSSEEKIYDSGVTDIHGNMIKKGVVKGMTLSPTFIWLKRNLYNRMFATSLVHELVHVALWAQGCRNGDPDHEGDAIDCWSANHTSFILKTNKLLADMDI